MRSTVAMVTGCDTAPATISAMPAAMTSFARRVSSSVSVFAIGSPPADPRPPSASTPLLAAVLGQSARTPQRSALHPGIAQFAGRVDVLHGPDRGQNLREIVRLRRLERREIDVRLELPLPKLLAERQDRQRACLLQHSCLLLVCASRYARARGQRSERHNPRRRCQVYHHGTVSERGWGPANLVRASTVNVRAFGRLCTSGK